MPPLQLEGDTLGRKHQHYNKLVKEAIANNERIESNKIDFADGDVKNLLKIDICCTNRNVEYIMEVLKCADMLYVSRAIKLSTWLVTDKEYAHIVNPQFLHLQLFPQMSRKAINKFLLHVRLNLKDENRVEEFFDFYKEDNLKSAMKWLVDCSVLFIQKVVENNVNDIPISLLKRLCLKSASIFKIFFQKYSSYAKNILQETMFLLNTEPEMYLDVVEKVNNYELPNFDKKFTKLLMKKHKNRVLDKFEKYCSCIHINTFAKYLINNEVKDLLLKYASHEDMYDLFDYENTKSLLKHMPIDGRYDFVKEIFIEEKHKNSCKTTDCKICKLLQKFNNTYLSESENVCRWYEFAPFEIAFKELKKYIHTEKSLDTKYTILEILLKGTKGSIKNLECVLLYYQDKHIKDPFINKLQFVGEVLKLVVVNKCDESIWTMLNNIFKSMDVYTKSSDIAINCIEYIIVYKIIHNEEIPAVLEEKFEDNNMSFKKYLTGLNVDQKEKLFTYVFRVLFEKFETQNIANKEDLDNAVERVQKILNVLVDWEKDLGDYSQVINKIKELIDIKFDDKEKTHLLQLYNAKKSWRKYFFEESLQMHPSDEVCLNILKHDPNLFTRSNKQVEAIRYKDGLSLTRFLKKLRIYWQESLSDEWAVAYKKHLSELGGHKVVTRGLFILTPLTEALSIINQYTPKESKINWNEIDEVNLSLVRNIAINMHFTRPQPPPDAVIGYAKGDYLQYALPSLHAIYYNLDHNNCLEPIMKLLQSPVSIQKHGIRFAFIKLKTEGVKPLFANIWKTSKNATIRSVLFKLTYELLCREKNPVKANEIWELLNIFIDNLSFKEDNKIYTLLANTGSIPLHPIRAKYLVKSYRFLKSLIAATGETNENCKNYLINLAENTIEIMEYVDEEFILELLNEYIDDKFMKGQCSGYSNNRHEVMCAYILCATDEKSLLDKYGNFLLPFLKRCFASWNETCEGKFIVRKSTYELLQCLISNLRKYSIRKSFINPAKMFSKLHIELEKNLPIHENYVPLTKWKLATKLSQILDTHGIDAKAIDDEDQKRDECSKASEEFGAKCIEYLKEDVKLHFPCIYMLFLRALKNIMDEILSTKMYLDVCKSMLKDIEFLPSFLVVIKILPHYCNDDAKEKMESIKHTLVTHPTVEVKMHYYHRYKSER